jgi:immune inhibitor A
MLIDVPSFRTLQCRKSLCPVPPSPELLLELYARYKRLVQSKQLPQAISFEQFYAMWRSSRRSENYIVTGCMFSREYTGLSLALVEV